MIFSPLYSISWLLTSFCDFNLLAKFKAANLSLIPTTSNIFGSDVRLRLTFLGEEGARN